jgi:protein-L-isoaspartate(D-aspartate) O-methyltransferase
MIDDYRHKGLRKKLIESIRSKGITDEQVLDVMGALPRHFFLDKAFEEQAYKDQPFPIGSDQTISQPYTVAYQTQLLQVKKGDKILEIGTGSGYQACVLAMMGARVYTIERQRALFDKTKKLLTTLGFTRVKVHFGDGYKGLPVFAPFDKIIITAAPEEIPEELLKQLKQGGIMILPKGSSGHQVMCCITKLADGKYTIAEGENFSFVPMLPGMK